MSDTLTLLQNQTQDCDGPAMYFPLAGETATVSLSGDPSGGSVFIDVHDAVMSTWTPVPQLTLNASQLSASFTFSGTADALRAHVVGSVTPNVTVTVAINP